MALGRDLGSQDPGYLSHDLMKTEDGVTTRNWGDGPVGEGEGRGYRAPVVKLIPGHQPDHGARKELDAQ